MNTLFLATDGLLRGAPWATQGRHPLRIILALLAMIAAFGMCYGAVMGTFGGVLGERSWQVLYSALKVPLLLSATFIISLPSFFVLNTLLGLRDDFLEAVRALLAAQAGVAVILASLAPFTAFYYASTTDYRTAVLFNGGMFAIASLGAQILLRRHYRGLIERHANHRWLLWSWVVIYSFIGIQMGWILRPFIGDPEMAVQFLRSDTWGNAYVVVFESLWRIITE